MSEGKKTCLHNFRSVYYGSEWEIECSKCNENVFDLYNNEDANHVIDLMLNKNKIDNENKRNNSGLVQLWRSIRSGRKENH